MRLLHTMLRVGDLQRSIDFYTEALGRKVIRKSDDPEGKFTNVFVGNGSEAEGAVIELTYNYGVDKYDIGTCFGHIAVAVEDAYKACSEIKARDGVVTRKAPDEARLHDDRILHRPGRV